MKKRIVIALGGNALGNNLLEQMGAMKSTSKAIADLIVEGHQVVISHGNGPQVGMINLAFTIAQQHSDQSPKLPLSVCVAMSQGYIGYDLQNALREELLDRNVNRSVVTIITQVVVDKDDEAFQNPTKPIGAFYSKEESERIAKLNGYFMKEDSGRGYRRFVASPMPIDIIEKDAIKTIFDAGEIVIAAGGGGIPVSAENNHLRGMPAVVDKDFACAKLAEFIDADYLVILTAVEKVAINFGKENETWLDSLTVEEADKYIQEGQFAEGSMLPKMQAAIQFTKSKPGRKALITKLEKAKEGISGKTGTSIVLS